PEHPRLAWPMQSTVAWVPSIWPAGLGRCAICLIGLRCAEKVSAVYLVVTERGSPLWRSARSPRHHGRLGVPRRRRDGQLGLQRRTRRRRFLGSRSCRSGRNTTLFVG